MCAELLLSLGELPSRPAMLGSLVAFPAGAWISALWRGIGQHSGKQACQSGSGVSQEQFKLLFLHHFKGIGKKITFYLYKSEQNLHPILNCCLIIHSFCSTTLSIPLFSHVLGVASSSHLYPDGFQWLEHLF